MDYLRWVLAERFHWTLPEIDSLPVHSLHEFLQIEDARMKAKHVD